MADSFSIFPCPLGIKFGIDVQYIEYKKRGFTQYSLAKKLGRSTRYLNNLEHDRSEPRFTTILLLADAIGMDPGELVNAAAELSWAALAEEDGTSERSERNALTRKPKTTR